MRESQTDTYIAQVAEQIAARSPEDIAKQIEILVAEHDTWRDTCLNLNPAESMLSLRCRNTLASDMATRLTEGWPGAKLYPHGKQNRYIDEIEAIIVSLAQQQFDAQHVEWRPVSTSMAIAAAAFALLKPGDVVLAQSEDGGGNYAYQPHGPVGLTRAEIINIPHSGEAFEIDLEALANLAGRLRPRMIIVGGSNVLFPYPVREMREIADRVGAILLYDAAHLGLLLSPDAFQDPLRDGAHLVVVSTHKILGGPVGGLILSNDAELASSIHQITFPGFLQTRDQNKYAALAIALAETQQYGRELADKMTRNARALAAALDAEGLRVIGKERGYTCSHQVFLELGDGASQFEASCLAANILLSDCPLVGDISRSARTGIRMATHEISRLGMGESEMQHIARLMVRAARDHDTPSSIADEVRFLREHFTTARYSLDGNA